MKVLRWSKVNDSNAESISMWTKDRWVFMTEDIPSTVTGNYNPKSTITVSMNLHQINLGKQLGIILLRLTILDQSIVNGKLK